MYIYRYCVKSFIEKSDFCHQQQQQRLFITKGHLRSYGS